MPLYCILFQETESVLVCCVRSVIQRVCSWAVGRAVLPEAAAKCAEPGGPRQPVELCQHGTIWLFVLVSCCTSHYSVGTAVTPAVCEVSYVACCHFSGSIMDKILL